MTKSDALFLAQNCPEVPWADGDFHALPGNLVTKVMQFADLWNYRKPRNANGSRTREFFYHVQRRLHTR